MAKKQTKTMSWIETALNMTLGYIVAVVANYVVLPMFGHNVNLADSMGIAVAFTIISSLRSYFLRRFFEWLKVDKGVNFDIPNPFKKAWNG